MLLQDLGDHVVEPAGPLVQGALLLQGQLEVLLQPLHHALLTLAHPRGLLLRVCGWAADQNREYQGQPPYTNAVGGHTGVRLWPSAEHQLGTRPHALHTGFLVLGLFRLQLTTIRTIAEMEGPEGSLPGF